jgi:hypothetical protein
VESTASALLLPGGEKSGAPHDVLYWRFGEQMAIRVGDFKLVATTATPTPNPASTSP